MKKIEISEAFIIDTLDMFIHKYIKSASIEIVADNMIKTTAKLSVPETCFLSPPSSHLNSVDSLICLNQIAYICLFSSINHNICPFFTNIDQNLLSKNKRNISILEYEKIRFKKAINNHDFYGQIQMQKQKNIGNSLFIKSDFGFGNDINCKDFTGTVKLVIPNVKIK